MSKDYFDIYDVPQGHEKRFSAKLEALEVKAAAPAKAARRRKRLWLYAIPAAAVLALAIFLPSRKAEEARDIFAETGSTDWFSEAGDDPAAVYLSYMGQASEIYSEILSSDHDGSRGFQAASIAEEAVPLFDQLPDELNPEEKASILKEYYGDLLSALETIKNLLIIP